MPGANHTTNAKLHGLNMYNIKYIFTYFAFKNIRDYALSIPSRQVKIKKISRPILLIFRIVM